MKGDQRMHKNSYSITLQTTISHSLFSVSFCRHIRTASDSRSQVESDCTNLGKEGCVRELWLQESKTVTDHQEIDSLKLVVTQLKESVTHFQRWFTSCNVSWDDDTWGCHMPWGDHSKYIESLTLRSPRLSFHFSVEVNQRKETWHASHTRFPSQVSLLPFSSFSCLALLRCKWIWMQSVWETDWHHVTLRALSWRHENSC